MHKTTNLFRTNLFRATSGSLLVMAISALAQERPDAAEPSEVRPSVLYEMRVRHQPPFLGGTGDTARLSAQAFIEWAGFSAMDERADARRSLLEASGNSEIAQAFCDEAMTALSSDHTRALLVLALLGELRNPLGASCLYNILWQPLPDDGTVTVEDEVVERTSLSMLEAKAVEGLAYLQTSLGDQLVLTAAASHPSQHVRATAIDAFKWNHGDSTDAVQILLGIVQPDDVIFVDRIRREDAETADTFNAKLARYLTQHPEVIPPDPIRDQAMDEVPLDDQVPPPQW